MFQKKFTRWGYFTFSGGFGLVLGIIQKAPQPKERRILHPHLLPRQMTFLTLHNFITYTK
jgi:hypothetical protein